MNKNAPPDDGYRHMPKLKCPYGNHRFADVPDKAFRNELELHRLKENEVLGYRRRWKHIQSYGESNKNLERKQPLGRS